MISTNKIDEFLIDFSLLKEVPIDFCKKNRVLPVSIEDKNLKLICNKESDLHVFEEIKQYIDFNQVKKVNVSEVDMDHYMEMIYPQKLESIERLFSSKEVDGEILVDSVIVEAIKSNASDIHIIPKEGFFYIKYRIDGVLYSRYSFSKEKWNTVCIRIKVMSELDISETRISQDGSFEREFCNKKLDFRVSCHPVMFGESIVIRILNGSEQFFLGSIDYSEKNKQNMEKFIDIPDGLIIFTGPTGSGKTTSLYSILSSINHESNNIITLEDPIEFKIPFARQTDINKYPKMDYINGIKSILRQDPDVILIGEIRDEKTANMAIRAAMTGHKVFTTLHTTNIAGVVDRLMEFNIDKTLIFQYLKGIVAQRLVRKLCSCKTEVKNCYSGQLRKHIDCDYFFKSNGCEKCEGIGFSGRTVVAESVFLKPNDMQEFVNNKTLKKEIFESMCVDGIHKVKNGITSYEELKRCIDMSEYE
ncbi:GspE/PulE family protein [Candidatus Nesciobacter abundans]|uniref:Type II/IV secretion system protein n=1 Tax=Candidatus Nesciobacter abundans TaxID=2601668 RepID=A0A5C0UGN6_9PROT|nr:GspE/PulE family protein [Candidatus Nesciobacter abundans]QEK38831.1 type II/IV secretion system protein [Candidatus Nesciobacter abundans]